MSRLAFGYVRRSSYKQQENNSVEIQKQHIKEFAKRNHLIVSDEFIFIEDVTSAFTKRASKRRELMRLADKMVEMNIPTVIFHDESRMDRTGYSFVIDFYRPLLEVLPDLEVYTTRSSQPVNPESAEMKMNFLLFQYESEVKSERAVASLQSDLEKENNIRPGAKTPFGYTQTKKKLHKNSNADIVFFIFFLHSWGYSLQKIAFLLNEANIPSPRSKKWRTSTIENIIKNPVYTGNLLWNIRKGKEGTKLYMFENAHESIVNEYTLQLIELNKHLQEKYGRLDTPFLFLNKIQCQQCQCVLVTQNGSTKRNGMKYQYQYYVCKNCDYKVDIQAVHEQWIPTILKHIHHLTSQESFIQHSLSIIVKMIEKVEELIVSTGNEIFNLTNKKTMATQLKDRELELHIASYLEQSENELKEQQSCRYTLLKTLQAVDTGQFFSGFQGILNDCLGDVEKRLIILYFVDILPLSPNSSSSIRYKENVFDELISSLNGWNTEIT